MPEIIEKIKNYVDKQPYNITRLTVYHSGKTETLEYLPDNFCQNVYSVAKFFTMTAIGLLFDEGKLSLDDKICDILADELPNKSKMDERWFDCTVEMALKHRLGLPEGFLDIDCNPTSEFTQNYLHHTFLTKLIFNPGEERKYSDGAFYLLSCIVEKLSGKKLDDFLWDRLLNKLSFQEMAWSHCPLGHAMGATGLYIHTSDMVKLGVLYLNKGLYNGERLLSEKWIDLAVEKDFEARWDETNTYFYKGGMHGQKLAISPKLNAVVALTSFDGDSGDVTDKIMEYLGET